MAKKMKKQAQKSGLDISQAAKPPEKHSIG